MGDKLEKKIKSEIIKWLNKIPSTYAFSYSAYLGEVGIPDIICSFKGLFFAIEVKRYVNGKPTQPTEHQAKKIKILKNTMANVMVAWSLKDVQDYVKENFNYE